MNESVTWLFIVLVGGLSVWSLSDALGWLLRSFGGGDGE